MDIRRQSPDALLKAIRQEERAVRRGHLKIFFGYAAGVGKTCAMLKAAHADRHRGTDTVVGYAEPHMRPQTSALLRGLDILPPRVIRHGNIELKEFDLDAALARKPQKILVDELAHTNAGGCRHTKRYQDIQELLAAGIDVYTTVNVQHIESLNDMVASVTGVLVRERIPDFVFDGADQVELVDIEPQDLIERLEAGEVYQELQAQKAVRNFFTIENLTALRELALRRCADRMNLLSENVRIKAGREYYTDEHILVCLSSAPSNAKIIRTAARMASAFQGAFTALFVETPDFPSMEETDRTRLRANLRLAEQLGAAIETVCGDDVPFQIAEYARLSGVSKIVIGRSGAARRDIFRRPTLTERLIALAPNLDIHIIPDSTVPRRGRAKKPALQKRVAVSPQDIAISVLSLILTTVIGFAFFGLGFTESNIITVYILGVLVTSVLTTSPVCGVISSLLSVLVFNFFFTIPQFTLRAYDKGYPFTFFIMFLSSIITGSLASKLKQHARQSARAAFRTKVLFDTNQLLQQARGHGEILSAAARQLTKLLGRDIVIYSKTEGGLVGPHLFPAAGEGAAEAPAVSENEKAVAEWVMKNNRRAGATTDTLSSAQCLYLAIRAGERVFGVVGIAAQENPLDAFENSVLLSILGECALALESDRNAREKEAAAVLAENEQLRANLLRAISHDLRTPLTAISGNASNLLSNLDGLDDSMKRQIYTDIYDDSMWLINLVENLLSVTRIEEGRMKIRLSAELMEEVIREALCHISRRSAEHCITVHSAQDLILARMDARLIVQVVINLVDNAIKYTPAGSHIGIASEQRGDRVFVSIADDGPGIPDAFKSRIFDMFYSGANGAADSRRSLGLGLSLCKSIISAHHGEITVSDNTPRGSIFTFTLPAEEVTLHE